MQERKSFRATTPLGGDRPVSRDAFLFAVADNARKGTANSPTSKIAHLAF